MSWTIGGIGYQATNNLNLLLFIGQFNPHLPRNFTCTAARFARNSAAFGTHSSSKEQSTQADTHCTEQGAFNALTGDSPPTLLARELSNTRAQISTTASAMERQSSLLEAIGFWGKTSPSKRALTFLNDSGAEVDSLTYSEILARSSALASHLLENVGLEKGSTCLLVYPPCLDFTVAYLACLRAGVIAVPCFPPDPRRLKKDLHMFTAIQGSSGASMALTSRSYNYAKKVPSVVACVRCLVLRVP